MGVGEVSIGQRSEFQAVILAVESGAERLSVLTQKAPRVLLPIANRPLLFYHLFSLEKSGFEEVILVTPKSLESRVTDYALELYESDVLVQQLRDGRESAAMRIHIKHVKDSTDTAEALREVRSSIRGDVIVLQDELVSTEKILYTVADAHRATSAAATVLFQMEVEDEKEQATATAGGGGGELDVIALAEMDHVAGDSSVRRLLMLQSELEVDDSIVISGGAFQYCSQMEVRRDVRDCHLYALSSVALDVLCEHEELSSLSVEFIPYLARKQFGLNSLPRGDVTGEDGANIWPLSGARRLDSGLEPPSAGDPFQLMACFLPAKEFARRIDSVGDYCTANRLVTAGAFPPVTVPRPSESNEIGEKSNVGRDCNLGTNIRVGEKSTLKKCIVGDHCTIGSNVRITNCVIMDHVTIADGCNISGGVISSNAHIQEKCVPRP